MAGIRLGRPTLIELEDGSEHEVMKNFPTDAELRRVLAPLASDVEVIRLTHYWLARYNVRREASTPS